MQNQSEEQQKPMNHFIRLQHTERKPSGRFSFVKVTQEDQQTQTQSNRERIRMQLKGKLSIIMNRTISNQTNTELDYKLKEISQKLDIELDQEDALNIIPSIQVFHKEYEVTDKLGEGCLGLVKKVINRETGQEFAIKIVTTTDEEIIRNMIIEFKNLLRLSHENIVKMHKLYIDYSDRFQSESQAYILMDLVEGSEMFEVINELGHYGEFDARELFYQLLSAIEYMHQHGMCHRDLKPHNILCVKNQKQIKVTDFNVSKFSDSYKEFGDLKNIDKIEMWTYTGTVAFSAPEIFTGEGYNQSVDIWSAGVILYSMLSGQLPFVADYLNDLIEIIREAKVVFPEQLFDGVSASAKDLIMQLLQKDWQLRPTPEQAFKHPWFAERTPSRRKTLKKLTLKANIAHLASRNCDMAKQRTILTNLGSSSLIGGTPHSEQMSSSISDSVHLSGGFNISASNEELSNSKHETIVKSKFSTQKYEPEISCCESLYITSPQARQYDNAKSFTYEVENYGQKQFQLVKSNQGDQSDIEFNQQA